MGDSLEGDVGSRENFGSCYRLICSSHYENRDKENNKKLQIAIMAPTEILANQHFESFIDFLKMNLQK